MATKQVFPLLRSFPQLCAKFMAPLFLFVVFLQLLYIGAQETVCPLDFSLVPYQRHESCDLALESGLEHSQCCKHALAYYIHVLAIHTNTTPGQPLFLDSATERQCWEKNITLGINYDYCVIGPPTLAVNSTPCNLGRVYELEYELLHGAAQIGFGNVVSDCNGSDDARCMRALAMSATSLSRDLNDTVENCGRAVLISVVSTDVVNSAWVNRIISLSLQECQSTRPSHKKEYAFETSLIFICSCIAAGIFITFFSRLCGRAISKRDSDKVGSSSDPSDMDGNDIIQNEGLYKFSKKELVKATKSFSSENYIGSGSAGLVHKGALPSGQLVAVKHIDKEKKADSFFKEVESLSKVRHPNLVSLLGYCQSGDDYYLVYEYCANGSLWQWLYGDKRALSWEERLNIALGSARGLFFLHHNPGGTIVHRDIKPTNILLNDNMDAKLSDFGVSKFIAMEESHVYTEVKGTSGYLDPEYMTRGQLTLASDIYSFGIVLLQLVSGRRAMDFNLQHRYSLVTSAQRVVESNTVSRLHKFVDPRLEGRFSSIAVRRIVEIAVLCTSQSSCNRPVIKEIRDTVEKAFALSKTELQHQDGSNTSGVSAPTFRSPR